jgi:hypothetical protein
VALLLICGLSTLGFAQTAQAKAAKKPEVKTEVVRGKILSIDPAKNEIVVKDNKTGVARSIVVDPKQIGSLKVDEEIRARLKSGSNIAESVKRIVHKTHKSRKKTSK